MLQIKRYIPLETCLEIYKYGFRVADQAKKTVQNVGNMK